MVRFIILKLLYIKKEQANLHSNMVRFIILLPVTASLNKSLIYIPIWLDLLLKSLSVIVSEYSDLHSNMVRFIIFFIFLNSPSIKNLHSNMVRFIIKYSVFV